MNKKQLLWLGGLGAVALYLYFKNKPMANAQSPIVNPTPQPMPQPKQQPTPNAKKIADEYYRNANKYYSKYGAKNINGKWVVDNCERIKTAYLSINKENAQDTDPLKEGYYEYVVLRQLNNVCFPDKKQMF